MTADAAEIVRLAECVEQAVDHRTFRDLEGDIYAMNGGAAFWGSSRPDGRYHVRNEVPHYLTSLDAAMSLLDPLWGYEQRRPSDGSKGACWAELWWVPAFPNKVTGFGQTPALALTAAALRARAASALSDGEG